jgi:hypothetical protein
MLAVASDGALAQQPLGLQPPAECRIDEPDSLQISWNDPCETGDWLLDTEAGCRIWDWHPVPQDGATWTGSCPRGVKSGRGIVQWYEHGTAIDRFEGTYVAGRREGHGRYDWNGTDWFSGFYADDLPHGTGTAHIAGETFAGQWHYGCFIRDGKVVAIGVSRRSCEDQHHRVAARP